MAINRIGLIYRSADAEVSRMPHPVRAMPLLSTSVLVRRQLAHLPATLAHKQALAQRYQQAPAALSTHLQCPPGAACHWVRYPFALSRPVADIGLARRLSQASGLNIGGLMT
jgi:hypothetical protein